VGVGTSVEGGEGEEGRGLVGGGGGGEEWQLDGWVLPRGLGGGGFYPDEGWGRGGGKGGGGGGAKRK